MKTLLSNLFIFATGATVGAVVTWKFLKTKYERLVQEEIDSYKEALGCLDKNDISEEETEYEAPTAEVTTRRSDYQQMVKKCDYKGVDDMNKPYVISPDDYGDNEEYDTETLFHFQDGVLTDDNDVPIEDVDGVVGADYADHFGEYEDDSVFIRNDGLRTDYEILLEPRNYSDVVNSSPHQAEEE